MIVVVARSTSTTTATPPASRPGGARVGSKWTWTSLSSGMGNLSKARNHDALSYEVSQGGYRPIDQRLFTANCTAVTIASTSAIAPAPTSPQASRLVTGGTTRSL